MTQDPTTDRSIVIETSRKDERGRTIYSQRTVQEHSHNPYRPKPFEVSTTEQLLSDIEALRADMLDAQRAFENKQEIDDSRTMTKAELTSRISELEAQIAELRSKLAGIEALGSARDEYIRNLVKFEQRCTEISSKTFHTKAEQAAQRRYEASYRELPATLKETVDFKITRFLKKFTASLFQRLHRNPRPSDAQLSATFSRVLEGANELEQYIKE
jgi:chromosome segregation ATPase